MVKKAVLFVHITLFMVCPGFLSGTVLDILKTKNTQLYQELTALPGFNPESKAALSIAELYLNSDHRGTKEAFTILLEGHNVHRNLSAEFGDYRQKNIIGYKIPEYNSALFLLYKMAGSEQIPQNDRVALSIALGNSFFYTFGEPEVQKAVITKSIRFLKLLRKISALQQEQGSFTLFEYPLEALMQMCRLWGTYIYGPTGVDEKIRLEHFQGPAVKKITIKRFEWNTIDLGLMEKLVDHFDRTGAFGSASLKATELITSFITGNDLWCYPAVPSLDPGTGIPYKKMSYKGISAMNSNWHNPGYILDMVLNNKKYYGWCTDVRQSMQFAATALGIASIQTGYGIHVGNKEYSHYFVLFFIPELGVWRRHKSDPVKTKQDRPTPVLLKKAVLNQWDCFNPEAFTYNSTDFYYIKNIKPSLLTAFYDLGIPTDVVKKITFEQRELSPGEVQKMSLDSDRDGLSDWVEKNVFHLTENGKDSDKDGYADSWELLNGFDPASGSSPANYPLIALDGLKDLKSSLKPIEKQDAESDQLIPAGNDLKSVRVYKSEDKIFICADFYAFRQKEVFHTIRITSRGIYNYWYQVQPGRWAHLFEFTGNTPFEQWKKSSIDISRIEIAVDEVVEIMIPIDLFPNSDEWRISYSVSGSDLSQNLWNCDGNDAVPLYFTKPPIRIDGNPSDLKKKVKLSIVKDDRNDALGEADIYDIKEAGAGIHKKALYVYADFFNDITLNQNQLISLQISFPDSKKNIWLQWLGSYFLNGNTFKDGTPVEQWTPLAIDDKKVENIELSREKALEIKIPGTLLEEGMEEGLEKGRIKVLLILGTTLEGKNHWNGDQTNWIELY